MEQNKDKNIENFIKYHVPPVGYMPEQNKCEHEYELYSAQCKKCLKFAGGIECEQCGEEVKPDYMHLCLGNKELNAKLSAIERIGKELIEAKKQAVIDQYNYEQAGLRLKPSNLKVAQAMDAFREVNN